MKYTIKFFVFLVMLFLPFTTGANFYGSSGGDRYICQGETCGWDKGVTASEGTLNNIEQDRPLSVFIIDVVKYLLTFLALVGIIMIIYAGFNILISAGDEEKVKTSRKIIIYVLIGMLIIFLAYPIVLWFEGVLKAPAVS